MKLGNNTFVPYRFIFNLVKRWFSIDETDKPDNVKRLLDRTIFH